MKMLKQWRKLFRKIVESSLEKFSDVFSMKHMTAEKEAVDWRQRESGSTQTTSDKIVWLWRQNQSSIIRMEPNLVNNPFDKLDKKL